MCGIHGTIILENSSSLESVAACESFITSRGPDSRGYWKNKFENYSIHLWHRRLSIIDGTTAGNQPMQIESSNWIIVFNGEIYNYQGLRDELIALGWVFQSASDTEVLLKAWSEWGVQCLPKLNGMFAFCVVDRFTGETWLVRDRFGVKPLLWGVTDDGSLVFSSSVAAVAESIGASVNTDYCSFGLRYKAFENGDHTAFNGVHSLSPGSWICAKITDAKINLQHGCWYDLTEAVKARREAIMQTPDAELLEECKFLVQDAVRLRLRSDVPLAVSLSGGLDSSTVAATAATMIDYLHGFTYGGSDAVQSEGPVVARFAKHTSINSHFIWPELNAADLNALLERTLACQEAPFPSLSVMAQNEVFRTVRDSGFKVLLGGQGGDEIFAGYRKFFVVATRYALRNRDMSDALRFLYSLGLMLIHEARSAGTYFRALSRYSDKHFRGFALLDLTPGSANLWGDGVGLADRQIDDIQRWSIPTLLRYEDRNSMGYGVESRLPFMDYRLVELALALPSKLKIAKGFGKWGLREIAEDVVPDFIRLNRKKRGFDVTQNWIMDGLGASLRARILDNRHTLAPYIRADANLDAYLSDVSLQANSNLLDEALMLAWLAQPIREHAVQGK
jgi:asparagine synthase (glutamine-hydrolysing)